MAIISLAPRFYITDSYIYFSADPTFAIKQMLSCFMSVARILHLAAMKSCFYDSLVLLLLRDESRKFSKLQS
jgi:hypothetical protein